MSFQYREASGGMHCRFGSWTAPARVSKGHALMTLDDKGSLGMCRGKSGVYVTIVLLLIKDASVN